MKRRYILPLGESSLKDIHLLGGKGAHLAELYSAGFPVPQGFGVVSTAYEDFLVANRIDSPIRQIIAGVDCNNHQQVAEQTARIRELVANGKLPDEIAREISEAYREMGENVRVAVRSSSAVLHGGSSSFPGQMDTFFDVLGPEEVLRTVKRCWASLWTARATANRWNQGIDHFSVKVSALVQEMVPSKFSGVVFTVNPVTGKEEFVIEAIRGLGESLVSGKVTPESFVLTKERLAIVQKPENSRVSVELIAEVADLARRVEQHYAEPQDIEWAYAKGKLYVLQSRAIRGRVEEKVNYVGLERWNKKPEPDEAEIIWTRAWSDEVLTRAITPLFYSVQADLITDTYDFIYRCYGLTELLPLKLMRFHKNRGYFSTKYLMECFRYVPEFARSDDALKFFTPEQKDKANSIPFLAWRKVASEIRLLFLHRKYSFTRCYKTYYEEWLPELLRRVKELDALNLESASLEQLESYFRGMEKLIKEHCQPIGFGVMIYAFAAITLLGKCLEQWCGSSDAIGSLLCGLPGNRTVEINQETWRFSRKIKKSAVLADLFAKHPAPEIIPRLNEVEEGQAFLKQIGEYARKYEFKGAEDRELSFPRWGDDPGLLTDVLKLLVGTGDEAEPVAAEQRNNARREKTTQEIRETLSRQRWGFFKKKCFEILLRYAQIYSLFRENQRYEVDRVFYGERKAFLAIGKRLVQKRILSELDDIWFLSKEEIFDAMWDKISPDEIRRVIVPRKAEYRRYLHTAPPMYLQGEREFEPALEEQAGLVDGKVLKGLPASAGQATGIARIVHNLRELNRVKPGDILVTNSTDPGWTPVFLLIRGLVLETGGILSHGTVLSREYGLPAVTSVKSATHLVKDGELITIDGSQGTVTLGA